ncbi:hypothetical protein CHS0354_028783, partial [Potamilus streckersoni]
MFPKLVQTAQRLVSPIHPSCPQDNHGRFAKYIFLGDVQNEVPRREIWRRQPSIFKEA